MPIPSVLPRTLFRKLQGDNLKPLEPGSPYYVEILEADAARDPILNLKTKISWAESESVHLLTGFRGNGKSTELRRLKQLLEDDGCVVYVVDMLNSLLLTKPLEVSDFLLGLMAALSQAIEADQGLDLVRQGYWERIKNFLMTEVEIEGLTLSAKGGGDVGVVSTEAAAELGLKLKTDPTFKERVQKRLRGHVTTLVVQAQAFVRELVQTLRDRAHDPNLKVVLLVDSVEQIRGIGVEAEAVHRSVLDTFNNQAASLAFPTLHVVYTVPPFFLALMPNAARPFGSTVTAWPNVHVRTKTGEADAAGLAVMESIIAKREAGWESLIPRAHLHHLAAASGGDIRDYFRLIRECLVTLETAKLKEVDETIVKRAEQQLLRELLPVAKDDARWLLQIHVQKQPALDSVTDLPRFARFLDSNLVMNYLNGEPWYDIHPLIVDEVKRLGAAAQTGAPTA